MFRPLILSVFLVACQSQMIKQEQPKTSPPQKPPFQAHLNPPQRLSRDLIVHYLAGEIAVQRGLWSQAYEHLLKAALEAQDPVAASKAARIAWQQKKPEQAEKAVQLWVEWEPNSFLARQMALLLAVEKGQFKAAQKQADALLAISRYQGKDDFLLLGSILLEKANSTALKLVEYYARSYPQSASAQYAEALLATQLSRFKQADAAIERSLKLKPDWDKPYLLKARNLSLQGHLDAAAKLLQTALKQAPSSNLWKSYARLMIQKKEYDSAIHAFEQAYQLEPEPDLLYTIGLLAMQNNQMSKARSIWQKLARQTKEKQRDQAYYFLGQTEESLGHIQAAIQAYQKVSQAEPLKRDARYKIAVLYLKNGWIKQAQALFNLLRKDYPQQAKAFLFSEIRLLKQSGRFALALSTLRQAAAQNDPDILYAYGLLAADLKRLDEAEAALKKALSMRPSDANILNALGYTLTDLSQRYQEAYAYIKQAWRLDPHNPAILDSLGWVLYRLGQAKKALPYLKKAAQSLDDPEIIAHLIEVLQSLGQSQSAQPWIEHAKKRYPQHPLLQKFYAH